ncbi:MAG: hypothetical protein ACK4K9_01270 [Bacteroidia bacterium]
MEKSTYYIDNSDNKHKIFGAAGSFLLHAMLVLGLMFFILYPPNPPLEEAGMTMSLGEENMGGPADYPVENPQPNERYTEITQQVEEQPPVTQDVEESVEINNSPKKEKDKPKKEIPVPVEKPKPTEEEKPKLELPAKVDMRAMFTKSNKNIGEGGRGDGDIPGNEGRPDGDPNGDPDGRGLGNYGTGTGREGSGTGRDGVSYELAGRSIKKLPQIEDNSRETGKVVVSIVVNRNGEVIKAVPGQKGTTTLSPALLEKAKQGALQAKFSSRDDGPDEQFGSMTFIFRFKP